MGRAAEHRQLQRHRGCPDPSAGAPRAAPCEGAAEFFWILPQNSWHPGPLPGPGRLGPARPSAAGGARGAGLARCPLLSIPWGRAAAAAPALFQGGPRRTWPGPGPPPSLPSSLAAPGPWPSRAAWAPLPMSSAM